MKKIWVSLVVLFLLMGVMIQPVRADMAPPYMPPGSNVVPGAETTQVRMVAETVVLTVSKYPDNPEFTVARTVATFIMRNLGTVEEKMKARFPLRTDTTICSYDYCPEITDLIVRVNGDVIPTKRQMLPFTYTTYIVYEIPWAVFDVTFPPAKDVIVEVSYTADAYGYYPFQAFDYILETGAGWKDTIGSADIVVRFPYEVNKYNVWLEDAPGGGFGQTSAGGILSGKEIRWHFDNLEPTRKDNFRILFIAPSLWESILRDSEIVAKYSKDGEAWGRLGKAYKEAALLPGKFIKRSDTAGLEMYQMSHDAYEKCLILLPNDSLWHFGYAELLWSHYFSDILLDGTPDSEGILPKIFSELEIALELDPNNQQAKDLLEWISNAIPGSVVKTDSGYILSTPTVIPSPTPSLSPTPPPTLSRKDIVLLTSEAKKQTQLHTPEPENTVVSTPKPVTSENMPVCGGTAIVLPALAGMLWLFRRKRSV